VPVATSISDSDSVTGSAFPTEAITTNDVAATTKAVLRRLPVSPPRSTTM
jgi:hypothetical protein